LSSADEIAPSGESAAAGRPGFAAAVRTAASGVTVVSTDGPAGRFGLTVSAMCRVSESPPLVLACLRSDSPASDAIKSNRVFCVNILGIKHHELADSFAGRPGPGRRPWDFGSDVWDAAPSGSPRLADAVATFDCAVDQVVSAGSHLIYIGQVLDTTLGEGMPLLYQSRTYSRPTPLERQSDRAPSESRLAELCGWSDR
jgi:flavin reductase